MSDSEGRYPYTTSRSRRRRKIQKRKRYGSLFIKTLMIVLFGCIAFYIGTKVTGLKDGDGNVQSVNSGLSESSDSGSDVSTSAGGSEAGSQDPSAFVVVVDPGHGGSQPGAVVETSDGELYEKDINLSIALYLETLLSDAGYEVILTRDSDVYVSLETRVQICNESDAGLFVSIHQNILEDDAVTNGVETWYWEGSSDALRLASCLQEGVVQATGAKSLGAKATDDLYVLHYTEVPAVLLESGFLSCADELENLKDSDYQQKIAEGILAGIEGFTE